MPAIERNDPVGAKAHRHDGHRGIHGAEWQVCVLANETGNTDPVIRVRGNHRDICKPFQEASFHDRAVTLTEKIGDFGHAQRRDDDVGPAS